MSKKHREASESAKIGVVVLAAGMSKRFDGGLKQLFVFEGESLVRRACNVALGSQAEASVVVLGYEAKTVLTELQKNPAIRIDTTKNERYEEGQSTSVAHGLEHLMKNHPSLDGLLFLPCDQPRVDANLLNRLIAAFEGSEKQPAPIVVPAYLGQRGSPVLFPIGLASELCDLEGDQGGRQILQRHKPRILELTMQSEDPLSDIDSLADVEALSAPNPR